MAYTYSLRNITGGSMKNPARPIILMTTVAGGAVGAGHVMINTDDLNVDLSQVQYDACKGAIDKYVKANMLVMMRGGFADVEPVEAVFVPEIPEILVAPEAPAGLTAEEVAAKIIDDPLLLSDEDMRAGKPMIKSLERIAGAGVDFKTADQTVIWDLVEASKEG